MNMNLTLLFSLILLGLISMPMSIPFAQATTDESASAADSTTEDEPETESEPEEEIDPEVEEETKEEEEDEEEDPDEIYGPGGPCYNPDDEDRCIEGPEDDPPDCDDSYPDDCIPSPPPNLNCDDKGVPSNIKVKGDDPHGFDHDNDGVGCENGKGSGGGGNGGGNGGDDDNDDDDKDNDDNKKFKSKKSDSKQEPEVKKFQVIVVLNETEKAESDTFRMRVIAYGPNTLNKPTLDKPGQLLAIKDCATVCYTTWGFTAYKVPLNTTIQACVWNPESRNKNCGWGNTDSQYGPEIITMSLPSLNK
jgi:hypothetical protein